MTGELELRAVVVDDAAPARRHLIQLLEDHPNVKVVGEANSAANAAALCRDLQPNLIFLDVQMPKGDGFSLLPKLEPLPAIIFVTAYDEYAVRAFEVNAVDYLLKPVNPERLAHSLQRVIRQPQPVCAKTLKDNDTIFLRSDTRLRVAYVAEISGIEANENYTLVHLAGGDSTLIRRSMTDWEKCLPPKLFIRPHRSLIVNIQAVKTVVMNKIDEVSIEIRGFKEPVRLGRRAAAKLRRALRQANVL